MPQAFAADLEKLFTSLQAIDTELIVQVGRRRVAAWVGGARWVLRCRPAPRPALLFDCCRVLLSAEEMACHVVSQAGTGGVSASVAADDAAVNRFLLDLVRCAQKGAVGWEGARKGPLCCGTCHPSAHRQPPGRPLLPWRRVGENNGIRFPREFGLLIKQLLYFSRQVLFFYYFLIPQSPCMPTALRTCLWLSSHPPQPLSPMRSVARRYTQILAPSLNVLDDRRINLRAVDLDYDLQA